MAYCSNDITGRDEDGEVLEDMVGKLLLAKGMTVTLAESCTGGLVMKRLSDIPGSSEYFLGGIVSYSNEIKIDLLGVAKEIIAEFGAVSEQTARSMASGIKKLTDSSIGVGITGIAGPGGGTPQKPVGLVYIALAAANQVRCEKFNFTGDRNRVRLEAADAALNMIRQYMLGL
ncbi:nicotinamide-nucleotide amidase [Desulfotomaculum arcticum]|uniref:Nicotinamide-nucleotide amidase n=2 Tax=Desulfotruncus TaxID=2867377 RepID=A0A1I2S6Q9_9FIRM|nr:nicotinamide-nucleotide amidase [Desulfotomaculum arcticum] [Desulfotruncus arcticus DSM 17038]